MKSAYLAPLCLLTLAISLQTFGGIYKSVDEDGNVVYTDNPKGKKEVEKVDLPTINTQSPTPVVNRPVAEDELGIPKSYRVSIRQPTDGTQIPTGQTDIQVSVSLTPRLQKGHKVQAYLNGKAFGPSSTSPSLTLKEVYRGEHSLSAAVVDGAGKVISRSDTITIYVQRHSAPRPAPRAPS